MDDMVRVVNVWESAGTDRCEWFEFTDNAAPLADSEKLYRLTSEFGIVCARRKFQ